VIELCGTWPSAVATVAQFGVVVIAARLGGADFRYNSRIAERERP